MLKVYPINLCESHSHFPQAYIIVSIGFISHHKQEKVVKYDNYSADDNDNYIRMQRVKSSSHTSAGSMHPISITSNIKFEKMEKLNNLVMELAEDNSQKGPQDQETLQNKKTRNVKSGISERVLQLLKNKIKDNYDDLYGNYPLNKQKILKQIQTVQTNMTGDNVMAFKQEEVFKEKSKHDRLRAQVEEKQSKIKRLIDLKHQLLQESIAPEKKQTSTLPTALAEKREEIEHNSMILSQMLSQRRQNYLILKHKNAQMLEQLTFKRERAKKLSTETLKRKNILGKIEEQLQQSEQLEIPQKLAEQLAQKIQMYENKHSYNNILEHEAQIEEERLLRLRDDMNREKQAKRVSKLKKEKEDKCHLQQLYNYYLIKSIQEEKIKKFCGVASISEVINDHKNLDKQNLQKLRAQIEAQIEAFQDINRKIQSQFDILQGGGSAKAFNIYDIEKIQEAVQKGCRKVQEEVNTKAKLESQWKTLMQLMSKDCSQLSLNELINRVALQYGGSEKGGQRLKRHAKRWTHNTSVNEESNELSD